ncbi:hypothetical protein ColTof4_09810 [Colletotrichum tofieldiae]|nr:hypothetical protein ColTof3_05166 [Colletotrichum tofieldiae]GKT77387.1 hypothetical protein ColTof4_09810 [Colletotrichum tofieldiae]GKT86213.1 hypothetical protein Ct61P_04063 [Colletotrichum tofieldiae]
MADPFGIIGVIGVAGQIVQCAVKLGLDWKDAPSDARNFVTEIQTLKTVLSETNTNVLLNDDFKVAFHGRRSTLLTQLGDDMKATSTLAMVSTCRKELDNLLDDLSKRSGGHRVGWERLKGAFVARKTRESVENLQRQCQSLNSLMAVDALTLGARIYREVKEARKERQDWKEDISNEAILDWVTPLDYGSQQSDFIGRRQEGTGQWLLDSTQYLEWTGNEKQTLFCPGIPGAGKTILTSIVVDDLSKRFRDVENANVAYIYCNFRRQNDQKVEDLLASVLKQLCQGQKSFPECVKTLFKEYKGGKRPSLNDISKALQTVVTVSEGLHCC